MKKIYLYDKEFNLHTHEFESMEDLRKIIIAHGNYVKLGDDVTLGDDVKLGNYVKLGDYVTLGYGVKLGDRVKLGYGVTLGDYVTLGYGVTLGDYVKLGDRVTLGDGVKLNSNPLYIIGTRNIVCNYRNNEIQIGCMVKDFDYWIKNYERVGKFEGYSNDEIAEYKSYIDFIINKWKES